MDRSDRFDVSDPRFDAGEARREREEFEGDYAQPAAPPPRKWMPCLIGCSAVVVLVMIVVALFAGWLWRNWRDVMATWAIQSMDPIIEAADLPPEDRRQMRADVRRVAEAFREERLTLQQLMQIVEDVSESPLLTFFAVSALEHQYFERSGLTEEEKVEGRVTLHRFMRGAIDGDIDQQGVDALLAHVADRQPDGQWRLRPRVTDEQLRAALAEARRQADQAGVPEEPEPFDAAAEFRRIVDRAMGEHEAD